MSAPADPVTYNLSDRELEVLRLTAEGLPVAEIAAELDISDDTVKTRRRRIIAKTQARDRTHAVVLALRSGELCLGVARPQPVTPHRLAALVGRTAQLSLVNGTVVAAQVVAVDADGVDVVLRTLTQPCRRYAHRDIQRIEQWREPAAGRRPVPRPAA
jgi:DNA-binding CsgD family transcriptional regulator